MGYAVNAKDIFLDFFVIANLIGRTMHIFLVVEKIILVYNIRKEGYSSACFCNANSRV